VPFLLEFCKKSPGFIDAAGTIAEQDEERQNDLSKGLLNGFIQPFQQPERVIGFSRSNAILYPVSMAFRRPLRVSHSVTGTVLRRTAATNS
jgi:hypothetical protein